ncbi:hypothetical protein L228DRAFT_241513 [Xylona heveae TC161]|uniref:Aminoglycoside phosphotransferase domain-containing protein n=1 Tax=Xylona heveae (strain CBS 132557 / TC161) TaxID=1328760 RepID=A0A165A018_XYLHT|nr:hypothetical protein L228DRAFT_241513 [Xylona heveae TC161]KZF19760.1 hypothetical protein L228DRAFT_241513 [Xylona heveae TC161]
MSTRPKKSWATINIDVLCDLASNLRQGLPCTCEMPRNPSGGSFNWVIFLRFEDGVEWVLRSPHGIFQEPDMDSKLIESEVATLRHVRRKTTIPVPEVFRCSSSKKNPLGIPYILMSKASGSSPENWDELPEKIKRKILFQLGGVTQQLSQLRFDKIGSLIETLRGLEVGECLDYGLFQSRAKYGVVQDCFIAPMPMPAEYQNNTDFTEVRGLWSAFIHVGLKGDNSYNRTDLVVAGDLMLECIGELTKCSPRVTDGQGRFPIYHPDLSANNFFVDDQYNITCVLDWSFASTAPMSVLVNALEVPASRSIIDESLITSFAEGLGHGSDETSIPVYPTRGIWLLMRLLKWWLLYSGNSCAEIWAQVRPTPEDFQTALSSKQALKEYQTLRNELALDDPTAEEIYPYESYYYKPSHPAAMDNKVILTIVRHLEMVSEWNSRYSSTPARYSLRKNSPLFKADAKLWKWILGCIADKIEPARKAAMVSSRRE